LINEDQSTTEKTVDHRRERDSLLLLRSLNMVIAASIGASTFIVFAMPHYITENQEISSTVTWLDF